MDVGRVVNPYSSPPLRGSRNPYKVEGFNPCLLAVILAYLGQLLSQLDLDFFYLEVIGRFSRGLRSFLRCPSNGFGFL